MTNITKRSLLLAFIILSCGAVASAQPPSLANIGTDKYTSETAGFEIAVPHQCMTLNTANGRQTYICDLKEGRVSVIVQPPEPDLKTEADVTAMIKDFDDSPLKNNGMKLLAEAPIQVGAYRGVGVKLDTSGNAIFLVSLYAVGRPTFVVSARSLSAVPNSEKLIADAFASFNFITPKAN